MRDLLLGAIASPLPPLQLHANLILIPFYLFLDLHFRVFIENRQLSVRLSPSLELYYTIYISDFITLLSHLIRHLVHSR